MAGDWIKMRNDLAEDPAVIGMASKLELDEFSVVGRLHFLWAWFDSQSRDGHAVGVTRSWINRKVQRDGFAEAMEFVGWLEVSELGVRVPNFERHNGETGKTRALGAKRKQNQRSKESEVTQDVSEMSRTHRDKNATREEKRREEKETPQPLSGFEKFWASWPKSNRKGGKAECEKLWRKESLETMTSEIVAHVQAMAVTENWRKQGGEFVPAPAVYLRGKRWDGAEVHGVGTSSLLEGAI